MRNAARTLDAIVVAKVTVKMSVKKWSNVRWAANVFNWRRKRRFEKTDGNSSNAGRCRRKPCLNVVKVLSSANASGQIDAPVARSIAHFVQFHSCSALTQRAPHVESKRLQQHLHHPRQSALGVADELLEDLVRHLHELFHALPVAGASACTAFLLGGGFAERSIHRASAGIA